MFPKSKNATEQLKSDHITIRRVKDIANKCSRRLYSNKPVPVEDMEILSVIIEEFVDNFHHGKEEKAYFPETKEKSGYVKEEIRKFLIEHELGRRIAAMLRRELGDLKRKKRDDGLAINESETEKNGVSIYEPVARFLKAYAVFIDDHTVKEDSFFDLIEKSELVSDSENELLLRHYDHCKASVGGDARMKAMVRLIEYLEERDWMNAP